MVEAANSLVPKGLPPYYILSPTQHNARLPHPPYEVRVQGEGRGQATRPLPGGEAINPI